MLERNRDANVKVFTVWEPILITDWRSPGSSVLSRISDGRVKQIWDPKHLVARQLAKDAHAPQPEAECCTRDGILWDLAAIYPPHAVWKDSIPPATLFNGPVVHIEQDIEEAIRKLKR